METKIVFTTEDPAFLARKENFELIESFDLGDRYAAKVRTKPSFGTNAINALEREEDSRIEGIENSFDGHLLMAPEGEGHVSERDDEVADFEAIREFHEIHGSDEAGRDTTVVVMDSGIDVSHPFFKEVPEIRMVDCTGQGHSDSNGHGTAVAGTIHSIAPEANLVSLRIFGSQGTTSDTVILRAYEWLHQHVEEYDIVNMSWGASVPVDLLDATHRSLVTKGVRDVVAAGNSGREGGSPATAEKAFSAGSITIDGELSTFSSYNPERSNPDICAVGQDCKLVRARETNMGSPIDDEWTKASGTSFSAPALAGMVARFWEAHEMADVDQIAETFQTHARDIPDTPNDGAGVADYDDTRDAGVE